MAYRPTVRLRAVINIVCPKKYDTRSSMDDITDEARRIAEYRLRQMASCADGYSVEAVDLVSVHVEPEDV